MARIVLAPQIQADINRIFNFLFEHTPDIANDRVAAIIAAIDILATSPRIGRPTDGGKRELIIATGSGGYVAALFAKFKPDTDWRPGRSSQFALPQSIQQGPPTRSRQI